MSSPLSSKLSAGTIDRACRLGQDVRAGDVRIAGAASIHRVAGVPVPADAGCVWVDILPDYTWRQVRLADVVIHSLEGANMETVTSVNKRRSRRTNLGSGDAEPTDGATTVDQEPDGQKRLEGMERVTDKEIEDVAWDVHALQTKRMKAGEKEKERRQNLTELMVAKGIDNYPLDDDFEVVLKKSAKAYVRKRRKTEPDDE